MHPRPSSSRHPDLITPRRPTSSHRHHDFEGSPKSGLHNAVCPVTSLVDPQGAYFGTGKAHGWGSGCHSGSAVGPARTQRVFDLAVYPSKMPVRRRPHVFSHLTPEKALFKRTPEGVLNCTMHAAGWICGQEVQ